ncbi:hypothetical protein [Kluyvera ascorbata]
MFISLWILIPIVLFAVAQTLNGLSLDKQLDAARSRCQTLESEQYELNNQIYILLGDVDYEEFEKGLLQQSEQSGK